MVFSEPWRYIETKLSGGRVLTVADDRSHLWMFEKKGQDKQFWRLEDNGCLRNKAHDKKCLGLDRNTVGGIPVLGGLDNSQGWKYKEIIFSDANCTRGLTFTFPIIRGM